MNREPRPDPASQSPFSAWLGLGIVAIAFVVAAVLTWRKWPDVLVDFGMQLYLPWKISTGSVLYRDLKYLTGGPLSQYYDAALFKLFGVSLLTLVISNLIIAAGLVLLIYRRFLAVSDAWTATTIGLGIVLVFAFDQHSNIGNYNFITPYSHEVWHGMVLSVLAITLLSSWVSKERLWFALGAGFCAGLVFMTKPEVFAALAAGIVAAFALFAVTKGRAGFLLKSLGAFALAAIVPLIAFACYFHRFENWPASLRSVAFAWVPLLTSSVSRDPFYKWCLGLDAPGANILAMFLQFAVVVAVLFACAILFRRRMDNSANRMLAVFVVALLAALASRCNWLDCGRSLPLISVALCVILNAKYWGLCRLRKTIGGSRHDAHPLTPTLPMNRTLTSPRPSSLPWKESGEGARWAVQAVRARNLFRRILSPNGGEGEEARIHAATSSESDEIRGELVFPLLWSIFGLALLAKMGLFSRIWHYGFVLAVPAFASAVYLLLWLLPLLLKKHGVDQRPFRGTVWLLLMIGFARLFVQSEFVYQNKTLAIGSGADKIMTFDEKTDPTGAGIAQALPWLDKNLPPNATLAVLPEGIMVNYLSRRTNPAHYLLWNPNELAAFGQAGIVADFENNRPDYIMLIHRDAAEYGAKYFGQEEGFGRELMQWIQQNYEPVLLIGNEPLQNSAFGIKILKQKR